MLWTSENTAKVRALEAHPQVALTIDTTGFPPHVLLVRGVAALETFEGVPEDYFRTASVDEQHRQAWEAEVRSLYRRVVRIAVRPEWVKLLDFETTLPSAVEELARQREQGATNVVDD